MTARNYIGLACSFHDPSVTVLGADGQIRFAEGTERRSRRKRALNQPPDDLHEVGNIVAEYCDEGADLVVAKSWRRAMAPPDVAWLLRGSKTSWQELRWLVPTHNAAFRLAGRNLGISAPGHAQRVHTYVHHDTHAAAAIATSPYRAGVCAVVDAAGDAESSAFYRYSDGRFKRIRARRSVGSLGMLYALVCEFCGFKPLAGEEWKVMGLAGYGAPDERIRGLLRQLVDVDGLRFMTPVDRRAYRRVMQELMTLARQPGEDALSVADFAHTGQLVFEERMRAILRNVRAVVGASTDLAVSGGCFLNSSYNGRILADADFRNLHVFAAPADDGNSLGAAALAWAADHRRLPDLSARGAPTTPFLGSAVDSSAVARLARYSGLEARTLAPDVLWDAVADALAADKIVALMRGRAEFGPRALGNRSIIASPRTEAMRDRINRHVKYREMFRPLAPAVLHSKGSDYFEDYQFSPYMERALRFREDKREEVPAVVHVDGTGRVQSVTDVSSPHFAEIIPRFERRTGIPLILNTSLNVMGQPIAHSVEDAMAVFMASDIDLLVLEDTLFSKQERPWAESAAHGTARGSASAV